MPIGTMKLVMFLCISRFRFLKLLSGLLAAETKNLLLQLKKPPMTCYVWNALKQVRGLVLHSSALTTGNKPGEVLLSCCKPVYASVQLRPTILGGAWGRSRAE